MKNKFMEESKKFALENCKMLYSDYRKPCTETCMCWGWEFGEGWNNIVKELSVKLETLNFMFYPKYGVRVVMDQTKEKFGTLRAYYHVAIDAPLIYRIWHIPFEKAYGFIRSHVDYGYKTETVKEGYYSDEKTEIPEELVEGDKKRYENCDNVKIEKDENGKWIRTIHMWHCPVTRTYATKHKFIRKIENLMYWLSVRLHFYKEPTVKQLIVQEFVESIARKYVREAEEGCYNVCEDCGTQIGTEWSKRVETKGWISYVCERCDWRKQIMYALNHLKYVIEREKATVNEDDRKKIEEITSFVNSEDYHDIEEFKRYSEIAQGIVSRVDSDRTGKVEK